VLVDGLALAVWAWLQLRDPQTLPIQKVRIEGEFRRLKPGQLQAIVTKEVRGGFYTVQVDAIREALLQDPWVKSVSVRRRWPDGLQVTVLEKKAVARWGERGLLDPQGVLFTPPKDSYPSNLIKLEGPVGAEAQVLAKLGELKGLIASLGIELDRFTLTPRRAWSFEVKNGPVVIIGRTGFEERVKRFVDKYPTVLSQQWDQLERIDLRYTNGFAVGVKLKQKEATQSQEQAVDGEKA